MLIGQCHSLSQMFYKLSYWSTRWFSASASLSPSTIILEHIWNLFAQSKQWLVTVKYLRKIILGPPPLFPNPRRFLLPDTSNCTALEFVLHSFFLFCSVFRLIKNTNTSWCHVQEEMDFICSFHSNRNYYISPHPHRW